MLLQRRLRARTLVWLRLRRADILVEADQQRLRQLDGIHGDRMTAITLAQDFAAIVRKRQAEQSRIGSLVSFAKGIQHEDAAVNASVTQKFSILLNDRRQGPAAGRAKTGVSDSVTC